MQNAARVSHHSSVWVANVLAILDKVPVRDPAWVLTGVDAAVVSIGKEADVERAARGDDGREVVLAATRSVPAQVVTGVGANERGLLIGAVVQRNVVAAARVGARLAARFLAGTFEVHLGEREANEVARWSGDGRVAVLVVCVASVVR